MGLLGLPDFEDEEADTLQDEASANLHPKEGSIQELIDKHKAIIEASTVKKQVDPDEDEPAEPN